MSKAIFIYRKPADPAAFEQHYFNTHVPLAKALPGLGKYQVSRGPIAGRMTGEAPHMIAILHFDTMAAMQVAFSSEIGQACAADRRLFAPDDADSTMLLFDEEAL
jgi:uncharacterized protein (TIGR02118 family)